MKKRIIFSSGTDIKILSDEVTDEMIKDYQQSINFINVENFDIEEVEVLDTKEISEFISSPISKKAFNPQFIDEVIPVVEMSIPELYRLGWNKDIRPKNTKIHLAAYTKDYFDNTNNNQVSTKINYLPDFNKQRIDCIAAVNILQVHDNRYIRIITEAYRRDWGTRFDHQITILDVYESLDYMDQRFGYVYNCMMHYKHWVKEIQKDYDTSIYKNIIDEKIPLIEDLLNKDENFDYKAWYNKERM